MDNEKSHGFNEHVKARKRAHNREYHKNWYQWNKKKVKQTNVKYYTKTKELLNGN